MVKAKNISFSFSATSLFNEANFTVGKGQKVAVVGPNGAGKTTLLNIIAGREIPTVGKIEVIGAIGFVPQEVKRDKDLEEASNIREYVDPFNKVENFELQKMLTGLELEVELSNPPKSLSGGQKTKLALVRALISEPEILILDEPTNFLDIAGKKWVMKFLSDYPNTLIIVSHDIALLDAHIQKVLAINIQTKKIDEYKGNYSDYQRLKKQREDFLKREIEVKKKHIKQMEEGLIKMARFTSEKGVRRRIQQKRRIEKEKLELPDPPLELRTVKMALPDPPRSGELPIRAVNIVKSFDWNVVLSGVNFTIKRGERVALIGPNGAGKSTLIKILMGILTPDGGEIIKDQQLSIGYYSQEFELFDFEQTLIEAVEEKSHLPENQARALLARFLFPGEKVFQKIKSLSGGEKTRLAVALVVLSKNNLLILDEPTTYLDVLSQRVILEALKDYKGAMLVVSHTPEFIKELKPHKALILPENKFDFWSDEFLDKVSDV